jgi:proteasome lid subunit RPN8/RPN11
MIQFLDEIEKHFEEWYPREGCGILSVIKGDLKWFPCNNVAEDEDDFIIDSSQYIEIAQKGDIVAVVHSHPDASCEPSQADINYCNATGIKYHIFSYPEMELHTLLPENKKKELYGREYEFGVTDCFEAMRDYLIEQDITIPPRVAFEDDWWEKDLDYFTDEIIESYGFTSVQGNMQKNDLIIFTIHAKVGNHCGVYLGEDIFYHHAENRLSCRENLYPFYKKYITGVYRYVA